MDDRDQDATEATATIRPPMSASGDPADLSRTGAPERQPEPRRATLAGVELDSARLATGGVAFVLGALGPLMGLLNGGFGIAQAAPLAMCVVVAAAVIVAVSPSALPRSPAALVALGGLAGLALLLPLSLLWSPMLDYGWLFAVKALAYLGAFVLALAVTRRSGSAYALVAGLAVGATAVATATVVEVATASEPIRFFFNEQLAGRVGYQNGYGALLIAGLLALVGGWATPARSVAGVARRTASAGGLAVVGVAALTSQSRGAALGAAAGLVVLAAVTRRRLRLVVPLAALAAALAFAFGPAVDLHDAADDEALGLTAAADDWAVRVVVVVLALALVGLVHGVLELKTRHRSAVALWSRRLALGVVGVAAVALLVGGVANAGTIADRVSEPLSGVDEGGPESGQRFTSLSANGRLNLWGTAVDAMADSALVGQGAGGFGIWWNTHRDVPDPDTIYAHSVLLEIGVDTGALGLALLAAWLGGVAWVAVAAVRRGRVRRTPVALLAAVLVAWLVSASLDWLWSLPASTLPAVVAAGALVGLAASRRPVPTPRRLAQVGTGVAAAALGVAAIVFVALPYAADRELGRAATIGVADPDAARARIDRAEDLYPHDPRIDELRARISFGAGDLRRARAELAEGTRRNPRYYLAHERLADYYDYVLDDERRAVVVMRRALALHREDRDLVRRVDDLEGALAERGRPAG